MCVCVCVCMLNVCVCMPPLAFRLPVLPALVSAACTAKMVSQSESTGGLNRRGGE